MTARMNGTAQVLHPLEPLLRKLMKGFVDEDDLRNKLVGLFEARALFLLSNRVSRAWR